MAQSRVLHYAATRQIVVVEHMQQPEHWKKAKLVIIVGARQPALLSRAARNIVLSRPLRGSPATSTAMRALRVVARTAVRPTAPTAFGAIPVSVGRCSGSHNNLSVWSFSLNIKTPAFAGVFLCSQSWHHQPLKKKRGTISRFLKRSAQKSSRLPRRHYNVKGIHNNNVRSGTTVMDCHANCVCSQ